MRNRIEQHLPGPIAHLHQRQGRMAGREAVSSSGELAWILTPGRTEDEPSRWRLMVRSDLYRHRWFCTTINAEPELN